MKTKLPDQWLVIGAGSLTGSRFIELSEGEIYGAGGSIDVNTPNLKEFFELDITDEGKVKEVISKFPGKYIINFAGATIVDQIEKTRPKNPNDQAELDQNLAYKINVIGTRNIIKACKETGKLPIFISTDFVFDGQDGPYSEEDSVATDPQEVSWYAWTKILAEKEAQKGGIDFLNIRISYIYRGEYPGKLDFARKFLKMYDDQTENPKKIGPIFDDQQLTPTFIDDIPEAIRVLVDNNITGIIHLTSPEVTTPYDFCVELFRVARGEENPTEVVVKGSVMEFLNNNPDAYKRPIKGGIKPNRLISLGFTPTSWKEGIKKAFGDSNP